MIISVTYDEDATVPIKVVMRKIKEKRGTQSESFLTIEKAIAEYLLYEEKNEAINVIIKNLRKMVDGEAGS